MTGSGRYLVGNATGADSIRNEITAQTRAAIAIDPQVSTVIELGGQDSKYVYLENGTPLDYQMNKACAAGTGSFIDELAEQLGISTRDGEFARLAFEAEEQLALGEKCAAFMGQAVAEAQQEGVPVGTIAASLATSLAENYFSKVVAGRRIGKRVILTGAVFYNEAVVAAFQEKLKGHELIVPEHKEVTGAIGAALLAKEAQSQETPSNFKGFSSIAEQVYDLTYFNCGDCEHACSISLMKGQGGKKFYYGSRCDRFDAEERSGKKHEKPATPFTTRESLLFADYDQEKGSNLVVGIPRALMTYDLAPMLLGFLNALGVRVLLSQPTNKEIIERSMQKAYPDSCFPMKVLHGHVEQLLRAQVDHILIPNAIRIGKKRSEADQHFACPSVQNAPYIMRSVFGLKEELLLDPVIDFSRGEREVVKSFIEIAKLMGFSEQEGDVAIRAGFVRQNYFETQLREAGQKTLDELADNPDAVGVVLLSRAYNAQDNGANLGMTEELRRLGVIPIPLDALPLDDVDISDITDVPYWSYERKILAASKIVAKNPQLFGLFLSNFGCGPNSFIQNIVEDIMGNKPLGQLEIDEHAAEAGYVTRLEALVDTIRSYKKADLAACTDPANYSRIFIKKGLGDELVLPRMTNGGHAEVITAVMRYLGVNARTLPESDDQSLALSRELTSGKECLPFRDTLGVLLRAGKDGSLSANARALMPGSFGPCRLGKYAQEQQKILRDHGIDLTIVTTVSDNSYSDLGLNPKFEQLAWQGIVAVDRLEQMLWRTRPYERYPGQTDQAYQAYLGRIVGAMERNQGLKQVMREAKETIAELRDSSLPTRPLVGINGEIYLRSNSFCNKDLVRVCEENGLEVEVAPMGEWFQYITLRRIEDAGMDLRASLFGLQGREVIKAAGRLVKAQLRKVVLNYYDRKITSCADGFIRSECSTEELIRASSDYIPSRNGGEAVLSIGHGVSRLANPEYAGVISIMPHGCMPGGVVASFAEQISAEYNYKPWISLTYDGFLEKVNEGRVAAFAEQIHSREFRNH